MCEQRRGAVGGGEHVADLVDAVADDDVEEIVLDPGTYALDAPLVLERDQTLLGREDVDRDAVALTRSASGAQ